MPSVGLLETHCCVSMLQSNPVCDTSNNIVNAQVVYDIFQSIIALYRMKGNPSLGATSTLGSIHCALSHNPKKVVVGEFRHG